MRSRADTAQLESINSAGEDSQFLNTIVQVKTELSQVFAALFTQLDVSLPSFLQNDSASVASFLYSLALSSVGPSRANDRQDNDLLPDYMLQSNATLGEPSLPITRRDSR